MCGIAAIFAYHYAALEVNPQELRRIRDAMSLRGPDGSGEWISQNHRVGLAHRRLSIIDLSERGAQPMQNRDGNLIVSFNGEIYNYKEIRSRLERTGRVFHSDSDTEVLLHLYEEKGEEMVHELRGMFAFVLWDARKKTMLLARDPYGIKPLYYADDGWTVRAASQVRALLKSDKVSKIPEPAGVVGFFLMGSVPEPFTTYQEIRQVPAGSIVTVNATGPSAPKSYFSIAGVFQNAAQEKTSGNHKVEVIKEALLDSVRHHFVSDVPVGVFLSAGIDSGSLVGLAREAGVSNLQTVTLGFDEFRGKPEDEPPLAQKAAALYGTKHHMKKVTREEFESDLPRILEAMDQPTIDGINTYFVSKAAKEIGLKVALSGLGGDELFGGYPSFNDVPRMVSAFAVPSRIPFLGEGFRHLFNGVNRFSRLHPKYSGLFKYGGTYPGAYFLKRGLFMPWELDSVLDKEISREGLKRLRVVEHIKKAIEPDPGNSFGRVAALEASLYLRNQLLRDADWAGMAHSLEIRTPFVDAFLLKKIAHFSPTKKLLATSLRTSLPDEILNRAKTGFGIPMKQWSPKDGGLNGRPWAQNWASSVFLANDINQKCES